MDADAERRLAAELFNGVWEWLETESRTPAEDDRMLHMAHASRYHWGQVGSPVNLARGEWQCSRVYAVLSRAEPCLFHGRRVLEICQENELGDFDLAFAYEALGRGYAVGGDRVSAREMVRLSRAAASGIVSASDRALVLGDVDSIPV